jgi:hypothetical protein
MRVLYVRMGLHVGGGSPSASPSHPDVRVCAHANGRGSSRRRCPFPSSRHRRTVPPLRASPTLPLQWRRHTLAGRPCWVIHHGSWSCITS